MYLASINGLCALATAFPIEIIELLMPEYIDMPNRADTEIITIETRIKLGEILVKTTRALGTHKKSSLIYILNINFKKISSFLYILLHNFKNFSI